LITNGYDADGIISQEMSEIARRRHARLTPEERKEAASKAAKARWAKTTTDQRAHFA
jgi:hypothetical protein